MAQQVISLEGLSRVSRDTLRDGLKAQGGCSAKGASACGSSAKPDDMPAEVWAKIKDHPCYSEEAHHYFARMHVAVAPACNIQCNYCNRKYDCANESRPGVVSEKLTPDQALRKVMAVAAKVPQLSVLGIAGPGDALANPAKTFDTFEKVSKHLPHLKLCLSTNGLALPDHVETIKKFNVDHVTITLNAVDPAVGEKIYPWIFFDHKRWTGRIAARILMERQLEGLEKLVKAGILVKVNSVLIPGINDDHLKEVNAAVKARGAFLHNVMPLISDPAHGTHFGLTGQRGPTPMELKGLQDQLEGGAKLMKHCRQCRADAVGLLGEDLGSEFTLDKIDEQIAAFDPSAAEAYRTFVEAERADRSKAAAAAAQELTRMTEAKPRLVAVATKGSGRINQHFGHASEFQVYEVDARGVRFVGHRRSAQYCQGGFGEEEVLTDITKVLEGIEAVFVARIGDCPGKQLADAGIAAVQDFAHEYIEPSIAAWYAQVEGDEEAGHAQASVASA